MKPTGRKTNRDEISKSKSEIMIDHTRDNRRKVLKVEILLLSPGCEPSKPRVYFQVRKQVPNIFHRGTWRMD